MPLIEFADFFKSSGRFTANELQLHLAWKRV